MSAADATQIDPGEGYRLLQVGEVRPKGYECLDYDGHWYPGEYVGDVVHEFTRPIRVKITPPQAEPEAPKPFTQNKYARSLVTLDGRTVPVDVYAVLDAFQPSSSAVQHAVKKLLAPGQRGHKTALEDLREARASIDRAIQAEEAARVRRNHLRRMLYIAEWFRNMEHFGSQKEKRYSRLLKRTRAALAKLDERGVQ